MKRMMTITLLFAACAKSALAADPSCEAIAGLKLPHTEFTETRTIARGAFMAPAGPNAQARADLYANLPVFCRVAAVLRPTSDSDIRIEVWLPTEGWNGRLQAVGNGGMSSSISYNNMAEALTGRYAVAATNTGHEGPNGEFALGHPEKLIDWGHRAVHEMAVASKAIIAAYYGSTPRYSYWNSCSTGGRQGLNEAERYPEDFDGIAVGAPANSMQRVQAAALWNNRAVTQDAASFITQSQWDMIHQAVLQTCDAKDGLADGLINDPPSCKFDPKTIQCKEGPADNCLTAAQIVAFNKFVTGAKNPRTGEQIFPGFPAGPSMFMPTGRPKPGTDPIDGFRTVFQQADWDYRTMDFDKDIARADALADPIMNAMEPAKLSALFARGGKILMYHGWNDPGISPLNSVDYYNKAVAANGGTDKTYNSIRLFLAPGMNHCQGGEGPNAFDKMAVMTQWVEEGKAPDQIVAAHLNAQRQVDRTRPLCPYPQLAKYKGSGSIDDAANFSCVKP